MDRVKRKTYILFAVALSLLVGLSLFGCNKSGDKAVPQVEIVSLEASDGVSTGKTDAVHLLTFTSPEGSKTSVSVQKNNAHATVKDYFGTVKDEHTQQMIFYAAGEYTVTVYAVKDGMQGSASKTITVVKPEVSVSDVALRAVTGEAAGTVDALYKLDYNATQDSTVAVTVKRNEQAAAATDYTFNATNKTVAFHTPGEFTVTVTATVGAATDSGSAQINITAHDSPQVIVTASANKVEEDSPVTLKHTVSYRSGDRRKSETYRVALRVASSGTYAAAPEGSYTLSGDVFTPRLAGKWRVTLVALGAGGSRGEGHADIECTAKTMQLANVDAAPAQYRIKTGAATAVNYTVSGAYDKYDVSFDTHGKDSLQAVKDDHGSVRVTASAVDFYTLTVVYTHKTDETLKHTLDIRLYSVESLFYSPQFGEDPFDGMPDEMLTSVGYLVYCSATLPGNERKVTGKDIACEITHDTMLDNYQNARAEIMYAASEQNYPYIMPGNFDDNTATGEFTVRMTVTDPVTHYAAVAEKTFTAVPTSNDEAVAAAKLQEHIEKYPDFFHMGLMKFDNAASDCRQNMVLTKTGTIMHRRNADWPLQHNGQQNADFAHMDLEPMLGSCRLEFKFTLIGANPANGNVCLGIGIRPYKNGWGWAGFINLQSVTEKVNGEDVSRLDLQNGLDNKGTKVNADADLVRPDAACGTTMYVRIDREVGNSRVTYTFYAKSSEDGDYKSYGGAWYSTIGANNDSPGADKIAQYQFTHRNAGGCYAVEDVQISAL